MVGDIQETSVPEISASIMAFLNFIPGQKYIFSWKTSYGTDVKKPLCRVVH